MARSLLVLSATLAFGCIPGHAILTDTLSTGESSESSESTDSDDSVGTASETATTTTTTDPGPVTSPASTTVATDATTTGDASTSDTSTTTEPAGACGDGVVDEDLEECDDGNNDDDDGCSAICEEELSSLGQIYLTSTTGQPGFYRYSIADDAWSTLTSPPEATRSQLTNDGALVYLLGSDNTIYEFDPTDDSWSVSPVPGPGPGLSDSQVGFFKWTDVGFYYAQDGFGDVLHYKDGAWTSIDWGDGEGAPSSAGSWDSANNELYIRTYTELGFKVLDTSNDTFIRTIIDEEAVDVHSRTGSFSGGDFYSRQFSGNLIKFDGQSGDRTDTGVKPTSMQTGSDSDPSTGAVYISAFAGDAFVFQRYDPIENTLTELAEHSEANQSSITVMIPH